MPFLVDAGQQESPAVAGVWADRMTDPEYHQYRLNHWMLRFVDDEAERTFNRSWVRGTSGITRIWAIAGLVFYVAYTIFAMVSITPEAQGTVWVLFVFVLPVLFLSLAPFFWA